MNRAHCGGMLVAAVLLVMGCSRDRLRLPTVPNQRPLVELTYAPASTSRPSFYACDFYWIGSDLDGRVDHYLYCLDPPTRAAVDTPWVTTTANRVSFVLPCTDTGPPGSPLQPVSYHVFVLKAVDDRGACSAPVVDAFSAFTLAPSVRILEPRLQSTLIWPTLPPSTPIAFTGADEDGRTTRFPVRYKYKLFPSDGTEADFHAIVAEPDSLRRLYAPSFAGWDSISGDTCRVLLRSLAPGREYLFAVVAFDEAGAYSPVFTLGGNLFRFACSYAGIAGPRLSIWNEYFTYRYPSGGYNPEPSMAIQVEVPSGRRIPFHWSAVPAPGADMKGYRWALDIASLDDETPRSDEGADWKHWSQEALSNTSCTLGPFEGASGDSVEYHTLYLEAEDLNQFKSLGMIRFRVTRPNFTRDLLFVNDTRFWVDRAAPSRPDSTTAPGGAWPSEAELDTFLFARGGVRWRNYTPVTTLSRPGVFNGYDFDTTGTRRFGGQGTIPLYVLGNYRHVVWMCDPALTFNDDPTHPLTPMPLLRWMSSGVLNTFGIYTTMGGSLWGLGGGFASNSLKPFNVASNDRPSAPITPVFSAALGELAPGRLMYDLAHWRSEITMMTFASAPINDRIPSWPGGPDYSVLPSPLVARIPGDPTPPMRSYNSFYVESFYGEALTQPNFVDEDTGEDTRERAIALDTLYYGTGAQAGVKRLPIMTYYHGREATPTVFSGFPLWYFRRTQAIQLGDFVLQNIWGLHRQPLPR